MQLDACVRAHVDARAGARVPTSVLEHIRETVPRVLLEACGVLYGFSRVLVTKHSKLHHAIFYRGTRVRNTHTSKAIAQYRKREQVVRRAHGTQRA